MLALPRRGQKVTEGSGAALPADGVAASVHVRNDDNRFAVNAKEDGVRKPAEKRSPCLSMDHRVGFWMGGDVTQDSVHGRQKLLAQPRPLPLIPQIRLLNVSRG